jgi:hypothetical protein
MSLLLLGSLAGQARAEDRITADITSTPNATLTAKESRAVSIAAGRLLKHAADARLAIVQGDNKKALAEIEKGQKLVKVIDAALPTYTVKAKITAGDQVYEDEQTERQRIVPIFNELDKYSMVAPLQQVRKEAEKQKGVAGEPVVSDAGIETMRVSLDVSLAKAGLDLAHKKMEAGKPIEADDALAMVQGSVFLTTVAVDMPLETARENLMDAKSSVEQGDFVEARASLDAAANDLKTYEKSVPDNMADAANSIRTDVEKLTGAIEKDHEGAINEINGLWDRVGKIMKK